MKSIKMSHRQMLLSRENVNGYNNKKRTTYCVTLGKKDKKKTVKPTFQQDIFMYVWSFTIISHFVCASSISSGRLDMFSKLYLPKCIQAIHFSLSCKRIKLLCGVYASLCGKTTSNRRQSLIHWGKCGDVTPPPATTIIVRCTDIKVIGENIANSYTVTRSKNTMNKSWSACVLNLVSLLLWLVLLLLLFNILFVYSFWKHEYVFLLLLCVPCHLSWFT